MTKSGFTYDFQSDHERHGGLNHSPVFIQFKITCFLVSLCKTKDENKDAVYIVWWYCRTGSKLGISPLMLAAMNGHTQAVKLLLDMGSDINAQVSWIVYSEILVTGMDVSGLLCRWVHANVYFCSPILPDVAKLVLYVCLCFL